MTLFAPNYNVYIQVKLLISHNFIVPQSSADISIGVYSIISIAVTIDECPINFPIFVESKYFGLIENILIIFSYPHVIKA